AEPDDKTPRPPGRRSVGDFTLQFTADTTDMDKSIKRNNRPATKGPRCGVDSQVADYAFSFFSGSPASSAAFSSAWMNSPTSALVVSGTMCTVMWPGWTVRIGVLLSLTRATVAGRR